MGRDVVLGISLSKVQIVMYPVYSDSNSNVACSCFYFGSLCVRSVSCFEAVVVLFLSRAGRGTAVASSISRPGLWLPCCKSVLSKPVLGVSLTVCLVKLFPLVPVFLVFLAPFVWNFL